MQHADLIVQGGIWRNIAKGIYMGLCLLHSAHLHSCKHTKPRTHLSDNGPMLFKVNTLLIHNGSLVPPKQTKKRKQTSKYYPGSVQIRAERSFL